MALCAGSTVDMNDVIKKNRLVLKKKRSFPPFQQVSFVASSGGYVSFVGIKGDGVRGIIAIDDITLYQGSCPSKPYFSESSI